MLQFRSRLAPIVALLVVAGCSAPMADAPTTASPPATSAPSFDMEPAPVAELVREIEIPWERFELDNGLTVVVHEDRKAPVVAVSIWYNVGSKDEPNGKTGFAHLFEHLMFNGSENSPGEYFEPLQQIGATDLNGTTWYDRTNYFQTVPTPALETSLFLESDRMGHLLGAVTQEKLDNQRGVVQNEKRQGDNQPFGLVDYVQLENLLPKGHPYAHSTIGSMADLDSASLEDVKQWFRDMYGPNNAVLVLAGDVNASEARTLVEKYFGDIPRGPVNNPAEADVPVLASPVEVEMKDRVAATRIYRIWNGPGLLDPESVPLEIGMRTLGGLWSSRLDTILVREEQLAVSVSAFYQEFHRMGFAEVQVNVKPGLDVDSVAARTDEIIAELIANGPSEDEVQRVVTDAVSDRIKGLEQVGGFGGKAVALAEGELYAGDPDHYKKVLLAMGRTTPADVQRAMRKWLTRPGLSIRVDPGERDAYEEAASVGGTATQRPFYYQPPSPDDKPMAPMPKYVDRDWPEVGPIADYDFPDVERATLSNGIPVTYSQASVVPVVRVTIEFDAGYAADPRNKLGLQSLLADLLEAGSDGMTSTEFAEKQERIGASISAGASLDRNSVSMSALTPNLAPSLALMASTVREPDFLQKELERLRSQKLTSIETQRTTPYWMGMRTMPGILFGPDHPYGIPASGSGYPETVESITRDDIVAAHQKWIRPDNAEIFAVGDIPLRELVPYLEHFFGSWTAPTTKKGVKRFDVETPKPESRIIIIDRPQSPQSLILGGQVLGMRGRDDNLVFNAAAEVLGGGFMSRINMDLRETKGWSYGSSAWMSQYEDLSPYTIYAPVQADRTGDSVAALLSQLHGFLGDDGINEAELERMINGNVRELAGSFETSSDILNALRNNALFERPDDYYETVADRYRTLKAKELDDAARAAIRPDDVVWIVVGDASVIREQLEGLGLPIEVVEPR